MAGRPSKLTPRLRKQIALAVSGGSSFRAAAEYAGVSDRTLRSWLARGRAEQDARRRDPSERPYVLLVQAVERAGAQAEVRAAEVIFRASDTDWRAAAWWLARRDPDNFGARVAVAHSDDEPDRGLEQLLDEATDEELEVLQQVALRARRPD